MEPQRLSPNAGFRVWDISDVAKPRRIAHISTGGVGVHRFDVDANYAYISTGMEGYGGNILINYDVRNPAQPREISSWWLPGQHIAGRRNAGRVRPRTGTCITPCAAAITCGPAASTRGYASSTSPTSRVRAPSAPITTTRRSGTPRTPCCACRTRSRGATSHSPSTRRTGAIPAGFPPDCGCSTSAISRTSSRSGISR